jgi:1-acyl-sn-glycerol-3-phosphate acyltransferase
MNAIISVIFWLYFALTLPIVFPIALIVRLVTIWETNRSISHYFSCAWSYLYSSVNPYWRFQVSDLSLADHRKTYVIVANHNSFIDILVLYRSWLNFKWVAKDELFRVPFFGWNMSLSGYIKIKRGDGASRKELFDTSSRWLRRGVSVLFFPEGTRSRDGHLQSFKPGAFKLAATHNLPILPLILTGTRDALPARSMIFSHRANMRMVALAPIDPADIQEEDLILKTNILMQKTRDAMAIALGEP